MAEKLLMKHRPAARFSNMNANIEPLTLIDIITGLSIIFLKI
jgi:hypothetical protein